MFQKRALEILKNKENVLLTGPAGSGKTFVLNKFIKYLKREKINVAITASTGIAAIHINGRTIHSWAGLGINHKFTEKSINKIIHNRNIRIRIIKTKTLIIDEVSMINDYHLDVIDKICKGIKKNSSPFGGIQIVLSGDFFQLSPINAQKGSGNFVNQSSVFKEMDLKVCYLTEQHRQADKKYLKFLNNIRSDAITENTKKLVFSRYNKNISGSIKPTKLYTHNIDVDAQNDYELNLIDEKVHKYQMTQSGKAKFIKNLKKYCLSPECLLLKKGAVVMFVKNNKNCGYVNGTLGKVIDFDNNGYPIVKTTNKKNIIATPSSWIIEEDEKELARINQIPLRLAWAITVHKSQGMTLDLAEIDLSKSFTPGMGYVALSRLRKLSGLNLLGINDMAYKVSHEAVILDKELVQRSKKNE